MPRDSSDDGDPWGVEPQDSGGWNTAGTQLKHKADSLKFDWHRAVARSGLPKITKLIAYALWDFTDQNGKNAHPGNAQLSEITGFKLLTVKRHMGALRAAQWITRVTPSNSHPDRKWADVYSLTIPEPGISQEIPDGAEPGISQEIPDGAEPGISQEIPDLDDRVSLGAGPGISGSRPGISGIQPGISLEIPHQIFSINSYSKSLEQQTPPPVLAPEPTPPEIAAEELKAAGTNPEAVDFILRLPLPKGAPHEYAVVLSRLQRCRGLTGPEIWELALSKKWIHPATRPPAWAATLPLEDQMPPARAGSLPERKSS